MSWVYLILAIVLEVLGTTCMKLSAGFTQLIPSLLLFVFSGGAMFCLILALKDLEVAV